MPRQSGSDRAFYNLRVANSMILLGDYPVSRRPEQRRGMKVKQKGRTFLLPNQRKLACHPPTFCNYNASCRMVEYAEWDFGDQNTLWALYVSVIDMTIDVPTKVHLVVLVHGLWGKLMALGISQKTETCFRQCSSSGSGSRRVAESL